VQTQYSRSLRSSSLYPCTPLSPQRELFGYETNQHYGTSDKRTPLMRPNEILFLESNDGHTSFTSTLQRTLDLLRPYIPDLRAQIPDGEPGQAASFEEVTNRFSKLELEELADQDLEQPTRAATQKPATPPKVTYVVDNGKEERWIAMNFLLHDFTCIKSILYTPFAPCQKEPRQSPCPNIRTSSCRTLWRGNVVLYHTPKSGSYRRSSTMSIILRFDTSLWIRRLKSILSRRPTLSH
jgi:hypothetical protein